MPTMPEGPSRSASVWSKYTDKITSLSGTPYTTHPVTPDNRSEVNQKAEVGQEEFTNAGPRVGRVVGGRFVEGNKEAGLHANHGPLTTVDIDMPLTLTEIVEQDGKEYIVLRYASGDPVNPFNWSPWWKRSVTTMLNLMTLFIGLATTAYSSTINSMTEEFGVSTEIGQVGLFLFNFVCAIAPLFLAPFCELIGRKVVYAGAYLGFTLCFIGLALGQNMATILVMRAFLGTSRFRTSIVIAANHVLRSFRMCRDYLGRRYFRRYVSAT